MAETKSLHVVMFPWFAFGHFIPFLQVANKLAKRGHKVSFVLPKGAHSKLKPLNHYPNLIQFFPLVLPQVDGLPIGAETASDVPSVALQNHLCTALDQCQDQLETVLAAVSPKPDFIFNDFGFLIPALARKLNIKIIFYIVVPAATHALIVPSKRFVKGMPPEELMQMPPGYPSSRIGFRANEAETLRVYAEEFGSGMLFYDRISTIFKESDVVAICTCQEIEGQFCEYLAQQYQKPVLVTGLNLPEKTATELDEKWVQCLSKFKPRSVVYCAFGSQIELQKDQFEELLLGFELCGLPFLLALPPPQGCLTVEEAFPEGFEDRIRGKGWVYGGWVPQTSLLDHPSVGCFVSHGGSASMWESLLSDCQIVLVPNMAEQIIQTRLMVEELKVAVEVERSGENRWVSKESLSRAIELVMDKTSEVACKLRSNHANLKDTLSRKDLQEEYMDAFVQNLQDMKG